MQSVFKTLWFGAGGFIVWYFGITTEIIVILAVLMSLDFLTGVVKCYAIGRQVKSKKATMGMLSKLFLLIIPFVIVMCGKLTGINAQALAGAVMGIIWLAEAYSIVANIIAIRTGKDVEEQDAITMLLQQVKKIIGGRLEKQLVK